MQPEEWTVRRLFEEHYCPRRKSATQRTRQKMGHELNRWERFIGADMLATEVMRETFDRFRELAAVDGLSPNTIETTIGSILTILRFAELYDLIDRALRKGEPLRRTRKRKYVPSITDVDHLYRRANQAKWPLPSPSAFWRAWLVCSYFTGLRLNDMIGLLWSSFRDDSLIIEAEKTGKMHIFPVSPILESHLEPLRVFGSDRVFPIPRNSGKYVRRELERLSDGLPTKIGPQALRRLAGTQWQRARWARASCFWAIRWACLIFISLPNS